MPLAVRLYQNAVNCSVERRLSPASAAAQITAENQPGLELNKAESVVPQQKLSMDMKHEQHVNIGPRNFVRCERYLTA